MRRRPEEAYPLFRTALPQHSWGGTGESPVPEALSVFVLEEGGALGHLRDLLGAGEARGVSGAAGRETEQAGPWAPPPFN